MGIKGDTSLPEKSIRIRSKGAASLDISEFTPYQGDLKTLSTEDYRRLRKLIVKHGFIDPIAVWKNQGVHYILDGHQRVYVVRKMIEDEEYYCPSLPVVIIEADTYEDAKEKLLALSTQFGRIQGDGLYNFMQGLPGMPPEQILEEYRFADFSLRDYLDEFYVDPTPVRDGSPLGAVPESPVHQPFTSPPIPPNYDPTPSAPRPTDQVSNTRTYKNETQALESFLGSDVRRITIYMNPNDYDSAVTRMSAIVNKYGMKDYRDVLFFLLTQYETQK